MSNSRRRRIHGGMGCIVYVKYSGSFIPGVFRRRIAYRIYVFRAIEVTTLGLSFYRMYST